MNLSVTQLSCQRGERLLFEHLSFSLGAHQWAHVTGENGAGKTSLLRLCAGLSSPLSGTITWNDASIKEDIDSFHQDLLYLGHLSALKDELTALENLTLLSRFDGQQVSIDAIFNALKLWGLEGREELPVRVLSAGQRRRVLLCRLLLKPSRLWILDEPFNALDRHAVTTLYQLLERHLETGGILLLTSHNTVELPGGQVVTL